jgi:hypothetical protein
MKKRKKIPSYLKKWKTKNRPPSSLEIAFEKILQEIGIPYVKEWKTPYRKGSKYFDFLLFEKNEHGEVAWRFVCETHGKFFHAKNYHDGEKTRDKLFKIQRKNLRNDATKKRILKELEIPLFVYWEDDVHQKRDIVIDNLKKIIQEFRDRITNRKTIILSENEMKNLNAI